MEYSPKGNDIALEFASRACNLYSAEHEWIIVWLKAKGRLASNIAKKSVELAKDDTIQLCFILMACTENPKLLSKSIIDNLITKLTNVQNSCVDQVLGLYYLKQEQDYAKAKINLCRGKAAGQFNSALQFQNVNDTFKKRHLIFVRPLFNVGRYIKPNEFLNVLFENLKDLINYKWSIEEKNMVDYTFDWFNRILKLNIDGDNFNDGNKTTINEKNLSWRKQRVDLSENKSNEIHQQKNESWRKQRNPRYE
ncbi:unnamed protein product [Macrosiphum euphorbiae]|uniref:Uncharacterized protein n=1 Tax=Macrosiphum euphorbiae TaxID=13131 RepID=A0AAV0VPE4_9HEMI|nr:unnamed protein product [Macrosiphum euphorbiae]